MTRTARRSAAAAALAIALAFFEDSAGSARSTATTPSTALNQSAAAPTAAPNPSDDNHARISEAYGRLSLTFEKNEGQTDRRVEFLSRGHGYAMFLSAGAEAVLALTSSSSAALRLTMVGANKKSHAQGRDTLPGKVNYLRGNDPKQWRSEIPTYANVVYEEVYPGIDVVYYGNQRQLEYDFIVRPGADPRVITFDVEGADKLEIDESGDLVMHVGQLKMVQRKPVVYQETNGVRREIESGYELVGSRRAKFEVASYNRTVPLVIDPILVYSTYLGGAFEDGGGGPAGVAIDATGSAYVTGVTHSPDFPVTTDAVDTSWNGQGDAFVTKLDPTGGTLLYSTFLGGASYDEGRDIAVDATGAAYVTGYACSSDFPTTSGSFDITINSCYDVFVTKLDSTGATLAYSTFLGGGNDDVGQGIALDGTGAAYVTGYTCSSDFPTTPGAHDTSFNGCYDAFVTKLDASGAALAYSTSLGGSSNDFGDGIAVDGTGAAYVEGDTCSSDFPTTPGSFDTSLNSCNDVFVTKLEASGAALAYATFLGGSSSEIGQGIAVDGTGAAYLTGYTCSSDFPTTAGAYDTSFSVCSDVFVTKLEASGATLAYSTFLGGSHNSDFGGSGSDFGQDITVDGTGAAYVTGYTCSTDFPTTPGAYDTSINPCWDAFVTKLDVSGSTLAYSTFLGGDSDDAGEAIAVDLAGNVYVLGLTFSSNFPTTPGAFDATYNGDADVFVTKIGDIALPVTLTLSPAAATNTVGQQHCVTARVRDAFGNPVPSVTVRFAVTGASTAGGSLATNSSGQATFCYMGPPLPGADAITAYADTDNDNTQDAGEPSGAATKTWVLPVTTPLCEITITNGGRITAANGDDATFGGNARASALGNTQGEEHYQDHGPVQAMRVSSIKVLAIVCESATQASIFGVATIDGAGSFTYRIRVQDLSEPGVGHDTYGLLLQTGYNSGEQVLQGGNVQIRREQ